MKLFDVNIMDISKHLNHIYDDHELEKDLTISILEIVKREGIFRDGDAYLLSTCFWASVQGIMEQMAENKKLKSPNIEWLISILKK